MKKILLITLFFGLINASELPNELVDENSVENIQLRKTDSIKFIKFIIKDLENLEINYFSYIKNCKIKTLELIDQVIKYQNFNKNNLTEITNLQEHYSFILNLKNIDDRQLKTCIEKAIKILNLIFAIELKYLEDELIFLME